MWFLKMLAIAVVSVPLAIFGTFMLGPLWSRVETVYGIESVGHAMYAGWCYVATYGVVVMAGLLLVFALPKSKSSNSTP
jgi:hypothetical protein